jgi:hypothetical protein
MDPPHPPVYHQINTTLTPVFVPTPHSVLAIESYAGLGGQGFTVAFLYNPLDPNSGIAVDEHGRLAPVLEARWHEFERAVAGAQAALQHTWGVGSSWSRPQNVCIISHHFCCLLGLFSRGINIDSSRLF